MVFGGDLMASGSGQLANSNWQLAQLKPRKNRAIGKRFTTDKPDDTDLNTGSISVIRENQWFALGCSLCYPKLPRVVQTLAFAYRNVTRRPKCRRAKDASGLQRFCPS